MISNNFSLCLSTLQPLDGTALAAVWYQGHVTLYYQSENRNLEEWRSLGGGQWNRTQVFQDVPDISSDLSAWSASDEIRIYFVRQERLYEIMYRDSKWGFAKVGPRAAVSGLSALGRGSDCCVRPHSFTLYPIAADYNTHYAAHVLSYSG